MKIYFCKNDSKLVEDMSGQSFCSELKNIKSFGLLCMPSRISVEFQSLVFDLKQSRRWTYSAQILHVSCFLRFVS